MKNLINFFFSFDKLFKEKLVAPFFWLAIIVWGLDFFANFLAGIRLGPLAYIVNIAEKLVAVLLALVVFRLISEIAIAIFRINDNLSPDGGKSELADIDPMFEARKAAEAAASKARELSKTAGERASAATKSVKDSAEDLAESASAKAKSATTSVKEKTESVVSKDSAPSEAATPKKRGRPAGSKNNTKTAAATKPKAKTTDAPKKRGRPAGSKNKTTKTTKAKSTSTGKKRGPKPGSKAPRDAQGRLLKKDGTLRGKPGPKT